MKAIIKRSLSVLLSISLTLGMVSIFGVGGVVEAKGEGEIELSSLAEVVTALGSNTRESLGTKTYKLTANISVGTTAAGGSNLYVLGDEDITLDLAG